MDKEIKEAIERIRLETSNICVNTNLDIIEKILSESEKYEKVIFEEVNR